MPVINQISPFLGALVARRIRTVKFINEVPPRGKGLPCIHAKNVILQIALSPGTT